MTGQKIDVAVQSYILIRHAETYSNTRARWHGESDEPISLHGRTRAIAAARSLCGQGLRPRTLICSTLRRAVQTAEIFANELNAEKIVRHPSLGERDMGDWKGLAPTEVEAEWPGLLSAWEAGDADGPPNGETDSEVTERALRVLSQFVGKDQSPKLVVTHGGVIRSLRKAGGLPNVPVPHLGGYWARVCSDGESWQIGREILLGDPTVRPLT